MQLAQMLDPDSLASYIEDASVAREALLERLADQIRRRLPGIQVTVDSTDGVIRFRADELFPRGTWRIRRGSLAERVSHAVGDALAQTLPCYTLSPSLDTEVSCKGAVAAIETIQIEGHTDDVGLSADLQEREQMRDNYDLSARRGAETLRVMIAQAPGASRLPQPASDSRCCPSRAMARRGLSIRPTPRRRERRTGASTSDSFSRRHVIFSKSKRSAPSSSVLVPIYRTSWTRPAHDLALGAFEERQPDCVAFHAQAARCVLQRAAASIARCWPHVEEEAVETDPQATGSRPGPSPPVGRLERLLLDRCGSCSACLDRQRFVAPCAVCGLCSNSFSIRFAPG